LTNKQQTNLKQLRAPAAALYSSLEIKSFHGVLQGEQVCKLCSIFSVAEPHHFYCAQALAQTAVLWLMPGLAIKNPPNKTQKNRLKKKTTSKRVLLDFFELTYIFGTIITTFHGI
jgi:hypothetical protein